MHRAQPNEAHVAIAELQRRGAVRALVTQNVDGLHQRAGSRDVVELHGSIHSVQCMSCKQHTPRTVIQEVNTKKNSIAMRLEQVALNPRCWQVKQNSRCFYREKNTE